jgi:hypothetical protein
LERDGYRALETDRFVAITGSVDGKPAVSERRRVLSVRRAGYHHREHAADSNPWFVPDLSVTSQLMLSHDGEKVKG